MQVAPRLYRGRRLVSWVPFSLWGAGVILESLRCSPTRTGGFRVPALSCVAFLQCRKAAPDSSGETAVVTCASGIGYGHVPLCVLVRCLMCQKIQILLSF